MYLVLIHCSPITHTLLQVNCLSILDSAFEELRMNVVGMDGRMEEGVGWGFALPSNILQYKCVQSTHKLCICCQG